MQVFYLEYRSKETTYFQIQIIEITTSEIQRTTLAISFQSQKGEQKILYNFLIS